MKTSAKLRTALVIVTVFLSVVLFAGTGSIKGTITDLVSGNYLRKITVQLSQNSKVVATATSNENGVFSFSNIADGIYDLNVQLVNGTFLVKDYVIVKTNSETVVDFSVNIKTGEISLIEPLNPIENLVIEDKKEVEEYEMSETVNAPAQKMRMAKVCDKGAGYAAPSVAYQQDDFYSPDHNTESYNVINENTFKEVTANPLSTFSIDVDRASYANVRRMLNYSQVPHKDVVRIEEMVNYFDYAYPQPKDDKPFSVTMEYGDCPWNTAHKVALIGIKGKEMSEDKIPANNLVFLIDVSGSMGDENKLGLLKKSFKVLVDKLRPQDRVAIVVYAGAAGEVLPSTSGSEKAKIIAALDNLQSGGSTAGGAGIELAYAIAQKYMTPGGNNRVILATDGDFNVGASSDAEMVRLIEKKRETGIFLTILGFGMGNYKDSKMEEMSNAGNGNYAYIDNILEANKMFGAELWGTLFTIAKDVKIQIEFNPAKVKAYRLIGYENRLLKNEDFANDKIDAGEIGSGHCVTALYEIIPAESNETIPTTDALEYQNKTVVNSDNIMTVKLRYKEPTGTESKLITQRVKTSDINKVTDSFYFATAVAEFGMILRDSEFKNTANFKQVKAIAKQAMGSDPFGYKAEFLSLVEKAELLKQN